jgi:hypothetical protein
MKSIKNDGLEPKELKSRRLFKTSLALTLIVFAFTMSSPSSFFQIIKPAMAAGTLTSIAILPSNNIVNTRTTYDIIFQTAASGTIKTIVMDFPSGFDVSAATRVIERTDIRSGSLSALSSSTLIYTVTDPVSVSAGTKIRLEIGNIINSDTAGSFKVGITTKDTAGGTIDGPTSSSSFSIEDIGTNDIAANSVTSSKIADNSITAEDVSTSFTIRKTLHDDTAGHTHGWNPDISTTAFAISDSDISGASSSEFVSVSVRSGNPVFCAAATGDAGLFGVYCDSPPGNSAELDYIITKLPAHDDVTLSLSASSSESTPSSAFPLLSSSPHTSALPDIASINRKDQTASEFP